MNFLQPLLLAALPVAALPIVIHLINQRRFQTIRWGAMMFLLDAQRMSRGYSRIRQWLILLFRVLAVAGLIFAISRPLSSGWLGQAAGGRVDTTLILIDRSASMQQQGGGTAQSKLETGCQQLVQTLSLLRSGRWILLESTENKPVEINSPEEILKLSMQEGTSTASDLPAMLEGARDYIQANKTGQTEIWICSDLRANDWNSEGGRWKGWRESMEELPQGVRIHLLAYPQSAPGNLSVRVTDVRRLGGAEPELLVSLKVERHSREPASLSIPIQFEIDGARSVVQAEIQGLEFDLKSHRIPLVKQLERGWGSVSIPADVNPGDNTSFLAYGPTPDRRTLIVVEEEHQGLSLQLAASISPEQGIKSISEVLTIDQIRALKWEALEWETIGSVLWQAPLPDESVARHLLSFVDRGGEVIFFPPTSPGSNSLAGVRWDQWVESKEELQIDNWRSDGDLLGHTQSGAALPVGELKVRRYCKLNLDQQAGQTAIPLAILKGGDSVLTRVPSDRGGVYFFGTTPSLTDSTLSTNGVVLYVLIQRALAWGAEPLKSVRSVDAGSRSLGGLSTGETSNWEQLLGSADPDPLKLAVQAGVYQVSGKTIVVNRPVEEDRAAIVEDQELQDLFRGLEFSRIDDSAGNFKSLIQEVWRLFMGSMLAALVLEAALSLPAARKNSVIAETRREVV